jgi:RHS repeat-associated protein
MILRDRSTQNNGTLDERLWVQQDPNWRDLSPTLGRWTAQDPLGFSGLDVNLYRYTHNNPTDLIDPSGLEELQLNGQTFFTTKPPEKMRINQDPYKGDLLAYVDAVPPVFDPILNKDVASGADPGILIIYRGCSYDTVHFIQFGHVYIRLRREVTTWTGECWDTNITPYWETALQYESNIGVITGSTPSKPQYFLDLMPRAQEPYYTSPGAGGKGGVGGIDAKVESSWIYDVPTIVRSIAQDIQTLANQVSQKNDVLKWWDITFIGDTYAVGSKKPGKSLGHVHWSWGITTTNGGKDYTKPEVRAYIDDAQPNAAQLDLLGGRFGQDQQFLR